MREGRRGCEGKENQSESGVQRDIKRREKREEREMWKIQRETITRWDGKALNIDRLRRDKEIEREGGRERDNRGNNSLFCATDAGREKTAKNEVIRIGGRERKNDRKENKRIKKVRKRIIEKNVRK